MLDAVLKITKTQIVYFVFFCNFLISQGIVLFSSLCNDEQSDRVSISLARAKCVRCWQTKWPLLTDCFSLFILSLISNFKGLIYSFHAVSFIIIYNLTSTILEQELQELKKLILLIGSTITWRQPGLSRGFVDTS